MDELHLCVLRALAVDETPAERAERSLDVSLLDAMTWPAYAWEMLRLTGGRAAAGCKGCRLVGPGFSPWRDSFGTVREQVIVAMANCGIQAGLPSLLQRTR